MAFDLTSIEPSEFIEFRDNWMKECGLDSVGSDRLFDDVGLAELIELDLSELTEYGKEIGLNIIERKRLIRGIFKLNGLNGLNGLDPKTPSTPSTPRSVHCISTPCKKSKKTKKDKIKRKRSKSRGKSLSKSIIPPPIDANTNINNDGPMYDPTNKTMPSPIITKKIIHKKLETLITEAISKLSLDANITKDDIRRSFMEFRRKLTEREMKLLHDVETTVDKKSRLLQSQLEYVLCNGTNGGCRELACDPNIALMIDSAYILRNIITAGWVQGALSENKEEEEEQERERKRRELSHQQYLTVERLKEITIFERDCATKREDSVRLTNEIQDEIQKINIRTNQCESELAVAKPLLDAAKKLVSTIGKTQLNEIRVLKKPPAVVELVMSSVAVILGNKIKSWRDIQKILANPKFVSSILEFDTICLKKKVREEAKKYIKHQDFNEERANKASKVAGPLVKWVKSQVKYSELLDVVRPKQKEIKLLKKKLDKKQKQKQITIQLVNELELKISKSRTEINEMVENMIKLQDEYDFNDDININSSMINELENKLELYKVISV